jgi:hypothetical protein
MGASEIIGWEQRDEMKPAYVCMLPTRSNDKHMIATINFKLRFSGARLKSSVSDH